MDANADGSAPVAARRDGTVRDDSAASPFDWLHRLAPARLTSRIIIINIVGLIILVFGILYFNQSRQSLIDARVESLMTQGHIIAAAVASTAGPGGTDTAINPEVLLDQQLGEDAGQDQDTMAAADFQINPERAGPILRRLVSSTNVRARVFDREGLLIVDSRYFYGRGEILTLDLPPITQPQPNLFVRWWNRLNEWMFRNDYPPQPQYGLDNGRDFPEIRAALNGASVSIVRVNENNEIIVSVAVPVQRLRAIQGALVLSTQGGEIDVVLRNERRIVFFTFVVAGLAAILLSLLLAGHIAEPIRRLARAAEQVRRGVNSRVEIPDFSDRRDEIGHLSGALRDMTQALYGRIAAIEAFAADVSHELKNPLTSVRSAVETLAYVKNEDQRQRLIEIVKDDVRRLDRLITDISDASRLDAELGREQSRPVDLRALIETLVAVANETRPEKGPTIVIKIDPLPRGVARERAFHVLGHENRLGQVVRNLLDNAVSFSPDNGIVEVAMKRTKTHVEFAVTDQGPGIAEENMTKVFDRFYTDRPEGYFGKNSGLGLSISKQIVEACRGTIQVRNNVGSPGPGGDRPSLGAVFIVRLPAMPVTWEAGRDREV